MMGHERLLTAKISVWWDIENCPVPRKVDPHRIAQNVSSVLHHANFRGPVTIDVFGDTKVLEQRVSDALSSTGINVNHIPSGKDAADKAILVAMLFWALDNPPPAHMFLISGDGDFANALHRLRFKGYNVLLARPDQPIKPALLGAAASVWNWTSVANGQTCDTGLPEKSSQHSKTSPYDDQLPAMSAPVNVVTSNSKQSQPFSPGKLDSDGHQSPSASSDAKITTMNPLLPLENLAQEMVESLLDKIKKAFRALKQDCLMPTEKNLQDCLRYWGEQVHIKQFLYKAIEMQEITVVNVQPGNSRVYLPLNTELWGCVSVNDMQHDYPNDIWVGFCRFFCCAKNRELFEKSHSRYEAAHILKDSGPTRIQHLSIGQIIHLLNQSVQKRKWLSIHGKNWSSLTINLLPVMAFAEDANSILGKNAGICQTKEDLAACVSNQDSSQKLIVFEKLRAWLIETLKDKVEYDVSLVPKDFKLATGIHLDPKKLGYSKLHLLIQEFSDVACVKEARKGLKVLCPLSKGRDNSKSAECRKAVPGAGTGKDKTPLATKGKCVGNLSKQASSCLQEVAKEHLKTAKKPNSNSSKQASSCLQGVAKEHLKTAKKPNSNSSKQASSYLQGAAKEHLKKAQKPAAQGTSKGL